jgi:hypothetical protein
MFYSTRAPRCTLEYIRQCQLKDCALTIDNAVVLAYAKLEIRISELISVTCFSHLGLLA